MRFTYTLFVFVRFVDGASKNFHEEVCVVRGFLVTLWRGALLYYACKINHSNAQAQISALLVFIRICPQAAQCACG